MDKIRKHAAGIDIGSKKVFISVSGEEVRSFLTFTEDLLAARNYLKQHEIETVAMEATGVYWIILYDILERAGFDVWLVDGKQTKQVPGRKTDVKDCQWIQQLHSHGLLNRCFVPDAQIKELRSYQRLREDHIHSSSMHINHMQKALTEMNIRLTEVLSQIHGKSGLRMIEAILSGERNKEKLLSMCQKRLQEKKRDQILKALEGYYTEAGIFSLQQAYEAYQFYKEQIKACDKKLEAVMKKINQGKELTKEMVNQKRKPIRHHKPEIEGLGAHMLMAFDGNDATTLTGITDYSWLQLLSEIGTDLSRWPTEKHFTSWLGLAPGQHNSGKKKKNKRKGRPKAGQIFRQIAQSIINSKYLAWGAFARRLRSKKGPAVAIKATARKIAVQYWRLMNYGSEFIEHGIEHYERILMEQKRRNLNKLALELNVCITDI
jgi:transposase